MTVSGSCAAAGPGSDFITTAWGVDEGTAIQDEGYGDTNSDE